MCFPDVFIWMIVDKQRIAYERIPAKDILQSQMPECQGKNCGKIQTVYLKVGKQNVKI